LYCVFFVQAKAFDKKTSVLQYLVRLIKKNDAELLRFKEDVLSVEKAKGMMLDGLIKDVDEVKKEVESVLKSAKNAGDKQRNPEGKLINPVIRKSLKELKEQKTNVREVNGIKFYNQMQHEIELSPMEIFALTAEHKIEIACEQIEVAQQKFLSVLNYFGEDEQMKSSEFFGTLWKFIGLFDGAQDFVERQENLKVSLLGVFLKTWHNILKPFPSTISEKGRKTHSSTKRKRGEKTGSETCKRGSTESSRFFGF
jgi:hypothetical protein